MIAHNSKGAADTFRSVILIILLLMFLASYVALVNNDINKRRDINTRETEIMKLSNTFNLLKRSLSMTWYISTVQTVFYAADQSLLCGADEPSSVGDALPPKYFYQFERNEQKNIKDLRAYIEGRNSGALLGKYNRKEPFVCYPLDKDVEDLLKTRLDTYTGVKESFKANDIDIGIDKSSIDTTIFLRQEGVASDVKQKVSLKSRSGSVDEEFTSNNLIYTRLKDMAAFSRLVVERLATFSDLFTDDSTTSPQFSDDVFNYLLRYQDLNIGKSPDVGSVCNSAPCDVKFETYVKRITDGFAAGGNSWTGLDQALKLGTNMKVLLNKKIELLAAGVDDAGVFNRDPSSFSDAGGLILHYDYSAKILGGTGIGDSSSCTPTARGQYMQNLERSVSSMDWEFTDYDINLDVKTAKFENDEIVAFMSAIIQTESNWNPNDVSPCGAAGIMQFVPKTATDLGIGVPQYNFVWCPSAATTTCRINGRPTKVSECNSCDRSKCDMRSDGRFDAVLSMQKAAEHINKLIKNDLLPPRSGIIEYSSDKDEILRITAATYQQGWPAVLNAINTAIANGDDGNAIKYSDIEPYLPDEARDYVSKVSGNFVCFGGALGGTGNYYFHDESRNTFSKKSVAMEIKAEDYLPAIDCTRGPYAISSNIQTANERDFFNSIRFFAWSHSAGACSDVRIRYRQTDGNLGEKSQNLLVGDLVCCGNALWSCNADVPSLAPKADGGTALSTGDVVNDRSNAASRLCDSALTAANNAVTTAITCRGTGFEITQQRQGGSANSCSLPTPGGNCEDFDENECSQHEGCWFHQGTQRCNTCSRASTCREYDNNPDACNQCKVNNKRCVPDIQGQTGDRFVCEDS